MERYHFEQLSKSKEEDLEKSVKGNQGLILLFNTKEFVQTVAKDFLETSKTIDFLIDHLPGIDRTKEQQLADLEILERENLKVGQEMEREIQLTKELLNRVENALGSIVEEQTRLLNGTRTEGTA